MKVEQITKHYEEKLIFQDYDLLMEEGKIYGLMGPSGRGKTTLLRIIAGLEEVEKGSVSFEKEALFSMVFQENRLFEWESVWKNIALVVGKKKEQTERIKEHLRRVGLFSAWNVRVRELSGGMKRRVAIVRAMMADSNYILMDEPFTGLDEATKKLVIQYVLEEQKGRTIVIATHSEEELSLLQAKKVLI